MLQIINYQFTIKIFLKLIKNMKKKKIFFHLKKKKNKKNDDKFEQKNYERTIKKNFASSIN